MSIIIILTNSVLPYKNYIPLKQNLNLEKVQFSKLALATKSDLKNK